MSEETKALLRFIVRLEDLYLCWDSYSQFISSTVRLAEIGKDFVSKILFVHLVPVSLGIPSRVHGAWAGENLTDWNHAENLPSVLTPKLYYQAKLLCKGCSSLRKSYFQFLL